MRSLYAHVVERAFQYLNLSECEVDSDTAREVLQIVDAELGRGEAALLSRVLDRLEQRLDRMPHVIPPAAPPLCRGSIGHT